MKGRYTIGRRALAAGLLLTLGAVLTTAAAQAGSTPSLAFSGDAFGSMATVGHTVRSDPTFRAALGACAAKRGDRSANSGASTNAAGLIRTGTVSNRVAVSRSGLPAVTSMSTTQSASLLTGLVRARVVRAKSRVTYTGSALRFGDGSRLVGLSVAGKAITSTAPANTRITLRNVGYLIVHERSRKVTNARAYQVINMLHLVVTVAGNKFGLRPGTNVIVGHAVASLQARVPGGPVIGGAYGSHAQVGKAASSGYSAIISLPCLGGSVSNTTAGTSLRAATTGTIVDTGSSRVSSSGSSGTLSSTIHSARLLKGLIAASVIHAQISGSFNGTTHSFSDNSSFAGLSVRGVHVKARPNTLIKLGFARLYLHRRIQTARGLTVMMIQLQVTHANTFGLKTGTDIRVGVVHLGFRA